jgi:F-type H+-transporting ATPase subunit b
VRTPAQVAWLLLLVASPAHAAGDGLLFPTINFVLLVVALFILLRKPIGAFFETRRSAIRTDLEEAAKLKNEAEAQFAKWQRKLDALQDELDEIRSMARERAETERASLLADARRSADRIRQDAAAAVDQEVRRARATLHDEASKLAVELAAGILREQVTDQDRARLLDEFIGHIERAPSAGNQA